MKTLITAFVTLLASFSLQAASITVEACAELEVTEVSPPGAFSSIPERCVTVSLDAVPDETADTISKSDERQQIFAYGGCNTSGTDITYTAERRIRYSIIEESFPPEDRTRARVEFSWLPEAFTSGSGSMSETINGGISNGVCADFFGNISAFAEASSGLDPYTLSNPTGATGLFYDPNNPGHGFNFIRHSGGFTVYYYGHTESGERLWLVSGLYRDRLYFYAPIELEMFEVTDGGFGTPMLPETSWGSLTVWLEECDSGSAALDGNDGRLEFDFVRLAGLEHEDCF